MSNGDLDKVERPFTQSPVGKPKEYKGHAAKIRLFNADNEAFGVLNGVVVFTRKTEGDPALQEDFNLQLHGGINTLAVCGVNWGGPAHIRYTLIVDDDAMDIVDRRVGGTANGLWYAESYIIDKAG